MLPPNERKPAPMATGTGSPKGPQGSKSKSQGTARPLDLQAARIHRHFGLSWPTARVVAELAFAAGGA